VSVPDPETRTIGGYVVQRHDNGRWSILNRDYHDYPSDATPIESAVLAALEEAERRAETAEQLVFSCPVCSWQLLPFAAAGGGAGPGEEPPDGTVDLMGGVW
jgi:hypothetical protein